MSARWSRVESLVREALARPPSERTAFLGAACRGDPALRHDVTSLLEHEGAAESFLEGPGAAGAKPTLVGHQFGAYRVDAWLGAGGMGDVYRARDTVLDRDVALKVLSSVVASDPDRLARLGREARILAALNHPHIASIYGVEEKDGIRALVLELLDGETLADRIAQGPLARSDTIHVAAQIADALAAAHEKGIVHRDLKPANIQITQTGAVKVLDFGIAKSTAGAAPTTVATRAGILVGTAAYMSPEQARGDRIDRQTDVWAFGCVLFEMLTGRRAFDGRSSSDAIAAVLEHEPDWSALPTTTPQSLLSLIHRCLQKDKTRRLRELSDARLELEEIASGSRGRWARGPMWVLVAGLAGLVAAVSFMAGRFDRPPAQPSGLPVRATITLAAGTEMNKPFWTGVALSPDGTRLAYAADEPDGSYRIYLRNLDAAESHALPGTEGGGQPVFDPTGQWLGFYAATQIRKVHLRTGRVVPVCNSIVSPRGASWGPDNNIYFSNPLGLWKVSAEGGTPQQLTTLDRTKGEESHNGPFPLPDGRVLLFDVWTGSGWDEKHIEALSLGTGDRHLLIDGGAAPQYLSPGYLVYHRAATEELWAARFDERRLKTIGEPVAMGEHVRSLGRLPKYSVSQSGTLVSVPGDAGITQRRLALVDERGKPEYLPVSPGPYAGVRVSPDGRRAAVQIMGNSVDIEIYDFARQSLTPFAAGGTNMFATWTRDSRRIVFMSVRNGVRTVVSRDVDSGLEEKVIDQTPGAPVPSAFSLDGDLILQINDARTESGGSDLWRWTSGLGSLRPLLSSPFYECCASVSPNGRWLAYSSKRTGQYEVYVQSFRDPVGPARTISKNGGMDARWSHDGREMFYFNGSKLMRARVVPGPEFQFRPPEVLFDYGYPETNEREYDIAPDGKRFLLIQRSDAERPVTQLTIVLNWIEELKRRLPIAP